MHYVHLHPVTDQHPAGTWPSDTPFTVNGEHVEAPLAGAGTPGVAEFAVEALATALNWTYRPA